MSEFKIIQQGNQFEIQKSEEKPIAPEQQLYDMIKHIKWEGWKDSILVVRMDREYIINNMVRIHNKIKAIEEMGLEAKDEYNGYDYETWLLIFRAELKRREIIQKNKEKAAQQKQQDLLTIAKKVANQKK